MPSTENNIRLLEKEKRRAEREVTKIAQKLKDVQQIANIGSWEWYKKNDRVTWSDELYNIFELEHDKKINYETYISLIHPEDRESVERIVQESLKMSSGFSFQHRIVTPTGREKYLDCNGKIYKKPSGEPVKILGTAQDITQRKHIEQKIDEKNKELRDFAFIVSHDLKAPLRGIQSLTRWLKEDFAQELNEEGKKQLNMLEERATHLEELINGILQFSRVTRYTEPPAVTDINKLVEIIIKNINPPPHIEIIQATRLPKIKCEKAGMIQVFQNLISNSVKYIDKPQGVIGIGHEKKKDHWLFYVKDNGPGIDIKYHSKIFQIFQTLGRSRTSDNSTGIGLTIVKKVLEKCEGKVWIDSKPGKGTTFYFTHPKSI